MNKRFLTILTSFILLVGVWVTIGHPVEDLKLLNSYTVQQVMNRVTGTSGSAIPTGALMVGGSNGTNLYNLTTDTSGHPQVDVLSGTVTASGTVAVSSIAAIAAGATTAGNPLYVADIRNGRSYPSSVTLCDSGLISSHQLLVNKMRLVRIINSSTDESVKLYNAITATGTEYGKMVIDASLETENEIDFPLPISTYVYGAFNVGGGEACLYVYFQ